MNGVFNVCGQAYSMSAWSRRHLDFCSFTARRRLDSGKFSINVILDCYLGRAPSHSLVWMKRGAFAVEF